MRKTVLLATSVSLLFMAPTSGLCQGKTPAGSFELIGTLSAFNYNQAYYDDWRPAGTLRARLVPRQHVHIEAAYTYAATRFRDFCVTSSWSECGGVVSKPRTSFTMGVGLHADRGLWKPFLGLGHGRFSGQPVWTWYVGIEALLLRPFGLVAEYRASEVRNQDDRFRRHHELGFGLAWKVR